VDIDVCGGGGFPVIDAYDADGRPGASQSMDVSDRCIGGVDVDDSGSEDSSSTCSGHETGLLPSLSCGGGDVSRRQIRSVPSSDTEYSWSLITCVHSTDTHT